MASWASVAKALALLMALEGALTSPREAPGPRIPVEWEVARFCRAMAALQAGHSETPQDSV